MPSYDYAQINSADGAIVIPEGSLDRWFAYRDTLGAERREVVAFGDSTTWGAGGLYSWVQRLRDRAVGFGMADGGKGMFGFGEDSISYDAPEVNGLASSQFGANPDTFDTLDGSFYYDNNHTGYTITVQFRTTAIRLWYVRRSESGVFTYSVNGGAPVEINAYKNDSTNGINFAYLSGLPAGQTNTLTVTNTTGTKVWVAFAPVNETGVAFQKQARSGGTISGTWYGYSTNYTSAINSMRYQAPLGLDVVGVSAPTYRGAPVDPRWSNAERVKPVLIISHLGFNDLSSAGTTDLPMWTEYPKRVAGACYDAGCDGIIVSGQLPYNAKWYSHGIERFEAMRDQAAAEGLGFVDLFYPIAGHSLDYAGGTSNPHLFRDQYEDQADFLWDNVLGADVSPSAPSTIERAAALSSTPLLATSAGRIVTRSGLLGGSPLVAAAGNRDLVRAAAMTGSSTIAVEGGRPLARFGRQRLRSRRPVGSGPSQHPTWHPTHPQRTPRT